MGVTAGGGVIGPYGQDDGALRRIIAVLTFIVATFVGLDHLTRWSWWIATLCVVIASEAASRVK
jgi:hypothetical protein